MARKSEEGKVIVDMTKAKTLELIPDRTNCLMVITDWKFGKSAEGNRKVAVESTVVEPESYKGRKIFDSISLDNDNTLGRLLQLLIASGMPEEEVRVAGFEVPGKEDMEGKTYVASVRIRKAKEGSAFNDQNIATNLRDAEKWEAIQKAAEGSDE